MFQLLARDMFVLFPSWEKYTKYFIFHIGKKYLIYVMSVFNEFYYIHIYTGMSNDRKDHLIALIKIIIIVIFI